MTNEVFVKEIYEPYNEAYRLMKMIKDCGPSDSDEIWSSFVEEIEKFSEIHDTEMGHVIARMLTDAADAIAKMNDK